MLVGTWKYTRDYSRLPDNGAGVIYGTLEYCLVFEKDLRVRFTCAHPNCVLEGTYKLYELHHGGKKGVVECDFALPKKLELRQLWSPVGRHKESARKVDHLVASAGFHGYSALIHPDETVKHDLPFLGQNLVLSYKSVAREYHLPLLDKARFSFVANEEGHTLYLSSSDSASKEIVYRKQLKHSVYLE